jgi:hypothetical protein
MNDASSAAQVVGDMTSEHSVLGGQEKLGA